MCHLFPQDNTEILGYLLGGIAAFGSWASRIPPLSRIVRLGRGWDCGSPWRVLGPLGAPSKLQVLGRSVVSRVYHACRGVCVHLRMCKRWAAHPGERVRPSRAPHGTAHCVLSIAEKSRLARRSTGVQSMSVPLGNEKVSEESVTWLPGFSPQKFPGI